MHMMEKKQGHGYEIWFLKVSGLKETREPYIYIYI